MSTLPNIKPQTSDGSYVILHYIHNFLSGLQSLSVRGNCKGKGNCVLSLITWRKNFPHSDLWNVFEETNTDKCLNRTTVNKLHVTRTSHYNFNSTLPIVSLNPAITGTPLCRRTWIAILFHARLCNPAGSSITEMQSVGLVFSSVVWLRQRKPQARQT